MSFSRMDNPVRSYTEPMLCIEIEKPDNEVLLSDEENWHFVLNNSYISDHEQDDNTFDSLPKQQKEHLKEYLYLLCG